MNRNTKDSLHTCALHVLKSSDNDQPVGIPASTFRNLQLLDRKAVEILEKRGEWIIIPDELEDLL